MVEEIGFDGIKHTYEYDAIGRLEKAERPDNRWKHFKYDSDSNLAQILYEFKSSATATQTPNQKTAFPEMLESGGTITRKGKDILLEVLQYQRYRRQNNKI